MYSWGGSTNDWKDSSKYKFDDKKQKEFDDIKQKSSARGGRSYVRRSTPDFNLVDAKGKNIISYSKNPIIVAVDVTGSMSSWPGEIFDRLPLFYQTLSQYRDDLEISFAAIGDANSDNYPLQVADFAKGLDLEDKLKALAPEGGGGGQMHETYELFGYFIHEHCKTPNAVSPFLFIFGDEKFYEKVSKYHVKQYVGDNIHNDIDSYKIWNGLTDRFNVFHLHKPYGYDADEKDIKDQWKKAFGEERVKDLPSAERAVDIAMGIVAKSWGQFGNYKNNISARQDDYAITLVEKSIGNVPGKRDYIPPGKLILFDD